jgi:acetylornithine deacetylase/succinyl-diaminopimelate desuccinylase-like protein
VLAVERAALAEPAETVATVGTLTVTPGAVSIIPGAARLGIDMRAIEVDSLNRLQQAVDDAVREIAEDRDVRATVTITREGSPVAMDPELASDALRVARERGIAAISTWSGAGHDAQHINGLAPALLVFVPLHDGQSHTPQEGARMAEILRATEVVTEVMGDAIRQM